MTTKERLHQLVDTLTESEAATAARVLEAMRVPEEPHPLLRALENAPVDDLPSEADDLDGGLTEARADIAAGRLYSADEVKRELGLA
jgi:hypothetical protein